MTLLELAQEFATRTGLPKPIAVIDQPDQQSAQVLALIRESLEDLIRRHSWSVLVREAVFSTVASETQGDLATLAPNGFLFILPQTLYNRTLRLPLYGPISAENWQALKAIPNAGPFYKYRIAGDKLLLNPAPPAGHTCAFEYASKFAVKSADGSAYRQSPTSDNDIFVLDDSLILACLRWKWKYEKGLEYAEDFRRYEELVNQAKSRDATKPSLTMNAGDSGVARPGIFVPAGNWGVH